MNNSDFKLADRKVLIEMLADTYNGFRYKAKQKYRDDEQNLRESLLKTLAKDRGADAVVKKIITANDQIEKLQDELHALGFSYDLDSDEFDTHGTRTSVHRELHQAIGKELGSIGDIDDRFDKAQVALMVANSRDEADVILKSVLSK